MTLAGAPVPLPAQGAAARLACGADWLDTILIGAEMKRSMYNRWLRHDEELPARCKMVIWIENASGYRYPVRSREVGRRLVAEWNCAATSERDKYELRGI